MNQNPVTLKEKIGYGLGDAACSMFWKLFSMYLLFFYTDIFGIPAAVVGTLFFVTRIWDSINDPLVGLIADRVTSRWGKFRPFILWTAIPFGVMGILTFTTPDFSMTGKIIYAYISYGVMMMIYSLINIPYGSLLGVMTNDCKTRTEFSSYRMLYAFLGSILALVMLEPLVSFFSKLAFKNGEPNLQFGWFGAVSVMAIIAVCFLFCTFSWTKERVKPMAEKQGSLKDDVKDLLKNRPWWILLGAGVSMLIFNSIRDGAAIYYFKYFVGEINFTIFGYNPSGMSLATTFLTVGQIGSIIGILLVTPISSRIGKKATFTCAMIIASGLSLLFYLLGPSDLIMIFITQLLICVCVGSVFPLLWSMYADIADYSELSSGRRATGLIFSSSSMSQKFGWTIGGAITGWLLGYYGFEANAQQSGDVLRGIKFMVSIFPAIGGVLSILFIAMYPLSESKVRTITLELEQIRNSSI